MRWNCSLNYARYQSWSQQIIKAAGFAFDGPAYKALNLASLQETELRFAQQHVRILDALYGILKPLDAIKPYRLEMSNKILTSRGSTMYTFWGSTLTDCLNRQVCACWLRKNHLVQRCSLCVTRNRELSQSPQGSRFIVNCASQARE